MVLNDLVVNRAIFSGSTSIADIFATQSALGQTGTNLFQRDLDISGALASQIAGGGTTVKVTGSANLASVDFTGYGSTLIFLSGNKVFVSGVSASQSVDHGDGVNISGNLAATGAILIARDTAISGGLEQRIFLTGAAADAYTNAVSGDLERRIALSGATAISYVYGVSGGLESRIAETGAQSSTSANSIGTSLSGNLVSTGSLLSAVKVTGSSIINNVNLTGLGGTLVISSGSFVFISGAAAGGPGGGVPSVNGITSAVTIKGTGNLSANVIGSDIVISGSVLTTNQQVIFDVNGFSSGDDRLRWDSLTGTLEIGNPLINYPDNPLSIGGSGIYLQANIHNRSSKNDASSDFVATTDVGSDTSGYIDIGINNSNYNQALYDVGSGSDGYIYVEGGGLAIGTATSGKVVSLHVDGTRSYNKIGEIVRSGINLVSGKYFSVNNFPITTFTRGGTFYNMDGVASGRQVMPVWMAPYTCRATSVRGHIISGTNATINAQRNYNNLLVSDLVVNATGAWIGSGIIVTAQSIFNTGDSLSAVLTQNVGNPVSIALQVDFIRI